MAGALALLAAACAPSPPPAGPGPVIQRPQPYGLPVYTPLSSGLPAIPRVEGPLRISVVQPAGGARPRVDSTAVYGSVGSAGVALFVNGAQVPVAENGAFLAYLPLPADGVWSFEAQRGGERQTASVAYRAPEPAAPAAPAPPLGAPLALVVRGGDTLATGSDVAYARPTPSGTYRWFFPAGTRLTALERRAGQFRVRLDDATDAWIDTTAVASAASPAPAVTLGAVTAVPAAGWVDVRIPARHSPFRVEADSLEWRVTVYGAAGQPRATTSGDALLRATAVEAAGASALVRLSFARRPWGYKAFYAADGTLVLRVRRPPVIDPSAPLRGRRIMIDPGHPPAGATGPTGLRESQANLAIALPLAEMLRAAGAQVLLTRTAEVEVGLAERTRMAVDADAELLVSVHNNAFGDGQNPFRAFHTTVYYFHGLSAGAAWALDREIATTTGLRDLGARAENLALVRATWLPSALTESLFMPIPEQENALRDAAFVRRLAEAHARGIEAYFLARARE